MILRMLIIKIWRRDVFSSDEVLKKELMKLLETLTMMGIKED